MKVKKKAQDIMLIVRIAGLLPPDGREEEREDGLGTRHCDRLAALKPEVLDHLERLRGGLAGAGEVSADEEGIPRIQGKGLEASQVNLSSAGHANLCLGKHEPKETEYLEASPRGEIPHVGERRAGHRVQEIHRDRIDPQRTQAPGPTE